MVYPISKYIFWPIIRLFIRNITGIENIPTKPFIMVANHSSYIDGPLLIMLVAWHRNMKLHVFATNQYFLSPFWHLLFQHFGAIRVNGSVHKGLDALKNGHSLLLFPEGSRTYDGNIQKTTHLGLGVLALKSKTPIVPVHMNTFWWWNRYRKLPTFRKTIQVTIGKPQTFRFKETKQNYKHVVQTMMRKIRRLSAQTSVPTTMFGKLPRVIRMTKEVTCARHLNA